MADKLEKMTRAKYWEKLKGLYAQLHELRPYSFQAKYPRSIAECVELVNFLTVAIGVATEDLEEVEEVEIDESDLSTPWQKMECSKQEYLELLKYQSRVTCSNRKASPVKLITFSLFRLSIDWLKCYICCLAESLIDHLNGNTGGWNDRQLLLPSSHKYKKVSLCEEMEIWHKYQDFELTQEDQPIFQRIIQAV